MRLRVAPAITGSTLTRSMCGVRSGVTLTAVTVDGNEDYFLDDTWLASNPHRVFSAKSVAGSLHVRVENVTIRDCYIRDRVLNYNGPTVYGGLKLEYCHIGSNADLSANTTTHRADEGIGRTEFDLYRCTVEGSSDAVRANGNNRVIECWLDTVPVDAEDHADAIQTDGGAGYLIVQRSVLRGRGFQGEPGNACYQQSNNPTTDALFEDCLFIDGGFQLRFDDAGTATVRRNVFDTDSALFGPVTADATGDIVWPVTGPDKNIDLDGATVAAPS
jgi:hypothetical protein